MIDVRELLRGLVKAAGENQAQVARDLKVSPAYLSDLLKGRRTPGPRVLRALGLRRQVVYVKVA